MQVPRSKLFVPGDRLDELPRAISTAADALSFDLEDSVAAAGKAAAREAVAGALRQTRLDAQAWVRVNGADSGLLVADLLSLAGTHVDVINLPKVEAPAEITLVQCLIEHIEAASGSRRRIMIVPTIESPRGLRRARAIAAASPRVLALQLGAGDLRRATGIDESGLAALRTLLSLAAAESGVAALDSTPHGLEDPDSFESEARAARALGMRGKSCMHPAQVPIANRIFADLARGRAPGP